VITTTVKKISELSTAIVVVEGLSELRGSINRYVTIRQYGRTVVGTNCLRNISFSEAIAALDTKKAEASKPIGIDNDTRTRADNIVPANHRRFNDVALTTIDDTIEQEKIPAKGRKKEPPRKRLDISETPRQFASIKSVNKKVYAVMGPEIFEGLIQPRPPIVPTTPQRKNTTLQNDITTSSEFNNECDDMMNDKKEEEDKDRKMRRLLLHQEISLRST
jgi:hypothetical protein